MLLSQPGIDVNIQNRGRVTALHVAAWKGHEGIVELLLKQPNINVNIPDRDDSHYKDIAGDTCPFRSYPHT